ncbi:TetR family transcriptional regulator [Promicromonospora sukumoe]|uniref:AcrR family transcriptional regulator n=1 Tax=Promicromonospora sukumoe TaxID=88382 RepID=A0A7W3J7E1_9MICO|nr:TetR/AcrR family transcriptional regulator [Promicromonospora sukumoe]MBA8807678.1 AcrR family transcriptional regulator [Promicromonospora sukumoe]
MIEAGAPGTTGGVRLRKQIATRRAVEEAAWRLFTTKGYHQTKIDEIVQEVGISQRSFFRYFDSKEAVLFGDWRRDHEELARRIEKADPALAPLSAVRAAAMSTADLMDRDRLLVRTRSELTKSSPTVGGYYRQIIQPAWEEAVASALASRLGVDPDVDPTPRAVAGAAAGMLNAAVSVWVAGGCADLLTDLAARSFDVLNPPVERPTGDR